MNKPYIIGISGGSGSGKTHFINELKKQFSDEELCVISQDEYYLEKNLQQTDSNGVHNFDLPSAIDAESLYRDLQKLISGTPFQKLEYTFNNPDKKPQLLLFKPAPVIITEGIFVFHYRKILELIDFKLFIHAKKEVKLERRLKRDATDRGYPAEHVHYTDKHHIHPSYQKYIKPFRHEADIVIPNNGDGFGKGLELITLLIKSKSTTT